MLRNFLPSSVLLSANHPCLAQDISGDDQRIRSLFNQYPTFGEDLLVAAFEEKPEEEFLLQETEDFVDELIAEFGDYLEKSQIGEPTHEGRYLELV